jgi:hypothetical protein
MARGTSKRGLLLLCALFGGAALYCLLGALRGRLFVGSRFPGHDAVLSGIAAWALFLAVLLLWLGIAVRLGFTPLPIKRRVFWELVFLVMGIVLVAAAVSGYLPTTRGA